MSIIITKTIKDYTVTLFTEGTILESKEKTLVLTPSGQGRCPIGTGCSSCPFDTYCEKAYVKKEGIIKAFFPETQQTHPELWL